VSQVIEHLPSKFEAPSSNPVLPRGRERERERDRDRETEREIVFELNVYRFFWSLITNQYSIKLFT
jgi:hypothetical protein